MNTQPAIASRIWQLVLLLLRQSYGPPTSAILWRSRSNGQAIIDIFVNRCAVVLTCALSETFLLMQPRCQRLSYSCNRGVRDFPTHATAVSETFLLMQLHFRLQPSYVYMHVIRCRRRVERVDCCPDPTLPHEDSDFAYQLISQRSPHGFGSWCCFFCVKVMGRPRRLYFEGREAMDRRF